MCAQKSLRPKNGDRLITVLKPGALQGLSQEVLKTELPGTSMEVKMQAINRLLHQHKLDVGKTSVGQTIYRQIEAGKSARLV